MPSLTQRIRMHSFLGRPAVGVNVVDGTDTDAALLSQIDSLLNAAAASFAARHYDDAVKIYLACESLIYAHLDPQWDPELTGKVRPLLPRDPSLFGPLLSATCQWLNVLPVAVSVSPVRPATPVAAPVLSGVSGLYGAGIGRVSANPAASAEALSDMHLAAIFADQGNTAASAATVARARSLDPVAAAALAPPGPAAAAPPQAPAPTAPAAPTAPVGPAERVASPDARSAASLLRVPGLSRVTGTVPVLDLPELPNSLLAQRQAGLLTGAGTSFTVKTLQWPATGTPDVAAIESALYAPHVTASELPDALTNPAGLWDRALQLPHDYFYVIPLAIAQCYQALGDYAKAETYYCRRRGIPT